MSNTKEKKLLKFTYQDGTEVIFEPFDNSAHTHISARPPSFRGKEQFRAALWVREGDKQLLRDFQYERRYNPKKYANIHKDQIWVGILYEKLKCGIPKGCYVPFKFNYDTEEFQLALEGLTNTGLLYNETLVDPEVLKKIKAEVDDEKEED